MKVGRWKYENACEPLTWFITSSFPYHTFIKIAPLFELIAWKSTRYAYSNFSWDKFFSHRNTTCVKIIIFIQNDCVTKFAFAVRLKWVAVDKPFSKF